MRVACPSSLACAPATGLCSCNRPRKLRRKGPAWAAIDAGGRLCDDSKRFRLDTSLGRISAAHLLLMIGVSRTSPSCSNKSGASSDGPSCGSESSVSANRDQQDSKVRVCGRDHLSSLKSAASNDLGDPRRSPGIDGYWRRHGAPVNVSRNPLPYFEAPVRAGLKRFAQTSSEEAVLPRCVVHQLSLMKSSGQYYGDSFFVLCVAPRRLLNNKSALHTFECPS